MTQKTIKELKFEIEKMREIRPLTKDELKKKYYKKGLEDAVKSMRENIIFPKNNPCRCCKAWVKEIEKAFKEIEG